MTRYFSRTVSLALALALALLSFAALMPASAAVVCYTDGGVDKPCNTPVLNVDPSPVVVLPGAFKVVSPVPVTSLRIVLPTAYSWSGRPVIEGNASIAVADERTLVVVGTGTYSVGGLALLGFFAPGDVVSIPVLAFNPNTESEVFGQNVAVANVSATTNLRVLSFNPASNTTQQTILRLVNLDPSEALVAIRGTDGDGNASGEVRARVPADGAVQLNSADLQDGNEAKRVDGALGVPVEKWTLHVISEARVRAHVLVRNNNTGTLGDLGGVEAWE